MQTIFAHVKKEKENPRLYLCFTSYSYLLNLDFFFFIWNGLVICL